MMSDIEVCAADRALLYLTQIPGPLETPCWRWPRAKANGYGVIGIGTRGDHLTLRVHRLMYRLFVGEIPRGKQLDHLCRVTDCANPLHLEAVTPRENVLRGESFAAVKSRQTCCIRGHRFTKANTRRRRNGTRLCIRCALARNRAWHHRKRLTPA